MNGWKEIVDKAYKSLDNEYRDFLENGDYFPDFENMFNAFKTLSFNNTKYILFGQDPYPRKDSAIGYAFIDAKVKKIFDENNGFTKEVNRAVSLRNFLKMMLYAEGLISQKAGKEEIRKLDKSGLIESIFDLKDNFEKNGILLLNRALIFTKKEDSKYHLKMWKPFVDTLLDEIKKSNIELIILGKSGDEFVKKYEKDFKIHRFEHPYNQTFITDENVLKFFKPFKLIKKLWYNFTAMRP